MEVLVVPFLAGLGSAASPCLLPLYPGFLAYLSGSGSALEGRRAAWALGFLVLGGVLTAMLAVGLLLAAIGASTGGLVGYLVPVVDLPLIAIGFALLADRNPFAGLPQARVPVASNPYASAYLYGLALGPVALPCAGPFLVAIFAISVGIADALPRVLTFVVYGLGFGLPLLLLSLVAGSRRQWFALQVARRHTLVNRVAGVVLLFVALRDLWLNSDLIASTFKP
ncbi:MAG: hypothetical protein A2X23_07815 [Chloroflexi bacterium GWC2_73_18]|nr:MAG: hypothetical protein A2X23_07815 [Chloroflexi bacterium GWC2_73_18]